MKSSIKWCPTKKCGKSLVRTDTVVNRYTSIYICLRCMTTYIKYKTNYVEIDLSITEKLRLHKRAMLFYQRTVRAPSTMEVYSNAVDIA